MGRREMLRMGKKYQREIEEILKQAGEIAPVGRPRKRSAWLPTEVWRYVAGSVRNRSDRFSPGRLMFIGVALLLSTLLFRTIVPWAIAPLAVVGVIVFVVGYAMVFIKPRPRYEKRWRGQSIEEDNGGSLWDRFRRK